MIVKDFQIHFGAQSNTDVLASCQAVSQDISNNPYVPYKLIIPAGHYYLSDTWEIPNNNRTVVIEAEIGSGHGTVFHPHSTFEPTVTLGTNYVPFVRRPGGLHDSYTTPKEPGWTAPGYDPDPNVHKHFDYRPLIRLRAMGEGSAFRGIAITGRDENNVARLGKGLWIDGLWFDGQWQPNDSGNDPLTDTIDSTFKFMGSNGLLIDSCKVNNVYAVLEDVNEGLKPAGPNPQPGTDFYPWLPGIAVQVGSASTDGATRQISNVRLHRSYMFGALGPVSDPFPMKTDVGIFFSNGNMKNYMVSECNLGFCRYGVRTAGSGYTNVIGCDFAANGSALSHWGDGADFLVPQAQVNIIGCGSEGSRRLVQGDGASAGFGALNIDACYWDGILAVDLPAQDVGYVIRNLNQAGYIRGLRVVTGGQDHGRAGPAAIQINFSQYLVSGLVLVNSHLDGVAAYLGDPLIYDYNNFLPPKLEELAGYADAENARIFVQNCTSRGYAGGQPQPVVPLQNYDYSSVKRIGGNSVKVTLVDTPGPPIALQPWHHTIVASATQGIITLRLPAASRCQGREYVIKRMDEVPVAANSVKIEGAAGDKMDGISPIQITLNNLQFRRIVSTGDRGWVVVGGP